MTTGPREPTGGRRPGALAVATTALSVGVLAVGTASFVQLDDAGRRGVYAEVAKLAFQFIVVIVLGTLLKKVVDDSRDHRLVAEARVLRQREYIRRLLDASHSVDLARTLIKAHRSATTWSREVVERVVPAYTTLRDIRYDLETSAAESTPLFSAWSDIVRDAEAMEAELARLIEEFMDRRRPVAEMQDPRDHDRRDSAELWERQLGELPVLREFLQAGSMHDQFRAQCSTMLAKMRRNLGSGRAS
jgi:hypothetical protein